MAWGGTIDKLHPASECSFSTVVGRLWPTIEAAIAKLDLSIPVSALQCRSECSDSLQDSPRQTRTLTQQCCTQCYALMSSAILQQ